MLRQPLEDKIVTISRTNGLLTFSANIQLIAGMNPCSCGWYGDPIKPCTCAPGASTKYQKRISGPLLDRIDIHIEVSRVDYEKLSKDRLGESSAEICQRVMISNPHILQRRCMLRSRPKLMAGWRVASQAFASRRHFGIHFTPNGIFSRSPYQADSTASQRPNIGAAARQTEFEAALLLSFI